MTFPNITAPSSGLPELPPPLDQLFSQINKETQAFRKIHRLLDTFEQFLKFLTVVAIQESLRARFTQAEDAGARRLALLKRLFTPTLGTWLEILGRMASDGSLLPFPFVADVQGLLAAKWDATKQMTVKFRGVEHRLRTLSDLLSFIVNARNEYAHGGTPPDEQILEDLEILSPLLERMFSEAGFLKHYSVLLSGEGIERRPVLHRSDGALLELYPFVLSSEDHLYFFSDAKLRHKQKLTFLDHLRASKLTDTDAYGALVQIVPEFDASVSYTDYYRQRLSESVIGREADARRLEAAVFQKQRGIWFVQGDPGVGKSAMSLYVHDQYFREDVKVYHMFLHNEADTLHPQAVVSSFYKPLLKEELVSRTDITVSSYADAKRLIHGLVHDASASANRRGRRIVCVVDGLDEAQRGGTAALDILPGDPPPGAYFLLFGRRDERFSSRAAAKPQWTFVEELRPLGKSAVRAILWQALSKYDLGDVIVDRVWRKSEGNAKYLDLLVEDLVEKSITLTENSSIPNGLQHYIEEIERRLKADNPDLPITEVALLFAVCVEPINAEMAELLIRASFDHLGENVVHETLHRMTEVIRPIVLKGRATTYQIYHKSFADYFLEKYPRKLATLKRGILFHAVNDLALHAFVEQLLSEEGVPDLGPLEKVAGKLRSFRTGYDILARGLSDRPTAAGLLERLYTSTVKSQGSILSTLFNDCLVVLFDRDPLAYIGLVERCLIISGSTKDLEMHLVDLLVVKDLQGDMYSRILQSIIGILRIHQKSGNAARYENLLNILGGYARFSGSFPHLLRITEVLLRLETPANGIAKDQARQEEILKGLAYELVSNVPLRHAIAVIRKQNRFRLRGDEGHGITALKMLVRIATLPGVWIPLLRASVWIAASFSKLGIGYIRGVAGDLRTAYDLWQRAFPLIFTSHSNPVANPAGVEMIGQLETVLRKWLISLEGKGGNTYSHVASCIREQDHEVTSNIFYGAAVWILPLLARMWNYSRKGLGEIARYPVSEQEAMSRLMPLLSPGQPIEPEHEELLLQFLLEEDAWRNYFAMVTIIIHGNQEYHAGARILRRMLEASEKSAGGPPKTSIENRLRVFRQFFSIYSYLIRRSHDLSLITVMADDLRWCLSRLLEAFRNTGDMYKSYGRGTIFGQGDPFNPLLPAGILSATFAVQDKEHPLLQDMLHDFEMFACTLAPDDSATFRKKMFEELVSLSLFFPSFAISTALESLKSVDGQRADSRKNILASVAAIDALAPGQLERMAEYLELDAKKVGEEIASTLGSRDAVETAGRVTDEILVFAWHECITTLMVYFPRVRLMLTDAASRVFGAREQASIIGLVQEVGVEFGRVYFSAAIGEQARNLLLVQDDSTSGI